MKKNWLMWMAIVGLAFGLFFVGIMIADWWNDGRIIQQEAAEIAHTFCTDDAAAIVKEQKEKTPEVEEMADKNEAETEKQAARIKWQLDYNKLKGINDDAIGWIRIQGTSIDHPIVQSFDNMEYMNLNIYREPSRAGTPFLDCTNSLEPLDSNLVIYGHNMGVGRTSAFSTLTKYKNWIQWKAHPIIELNLQGETSVWKIFAAIKFNVDDMGNFNYTTHNFLTDEAKVAFAEEAKQRSVFDTGVIVNGDDQLLTLSTCDRSEFGRKGRFIIMAVKE